MAARRFALPLFACLVMTMGLLYVGLIIGANGGLPKQAAAAADCSAASDQMASPLQAQAEEAVACLDKEAVPREEQRGDFWVLYNYVAARRRFRCWETITYTTQAEYIYLDNLKPIVERWQGPVSVALYAPGEDFKPTLESIRWARTCVPLVADLVTFHVFYDKRHVPQEVPRGESVLSGPESNCSAPAPWTNAPANSYRTRSNLVYPINVARNVARESATTHFVFASDIELYPSPGTIHDFLEMIRRDDPPLRRPALKVFPFAIFEIKIGASFPENKTELIHMLKNGIAKPFHENIGPSCHKIPESKEWQTANITEGLHVFHIAKRLGAFAYWEPFYIGTNAEPPFEERQSWEGKFDKHTQAYAMCLLDYEFHLLDNTFLVHKAGFSGPQKNTKQRDIIVEKTNKLIKEVIVPEYKIQYGYIGGCEVKK